MGFAIAETYWMFKIDSGLGTFTALLLYGKGYQAWREVYG